MKRIKKITLALLLFAMLLCTAVPVFADGMPITKNGYAYKEFSGTPVPGETYLIVAGNIYSDWHYPLILGIELSGALSQTMVDRVSYQGSSYLYAPSKDLTGCELTIDENGYVSRNGIYLRKGEHFYSQGEYSYDKLTVKDNGGEKIRYNDISHIFSSGWVRGTSYGQIERAHLYEKIASPTTATATSPGSVPVVIGIAAVIIIAAAIFFFVKRKKAKQN